MMSLHEVAGEHFTKCEEVCLKVSVITRAWRWSSLPLSVLRIRDEILTWAPGQPVRMASNSLFQAAIVGCSSAFAFLRSKSEYYGFHPHWNRFQALLSVELQLVQSLRLQSNYQSVKANSSTHFGKPGNRKTSSWSMLQSRGPIMDPWEMPAVIWSSMLPHEIVLSLR